MIERIKKTGLFIYKNLSYILWFCFFFGFSISIVHSFLSFKSAFILCAILYSISIFVALKFGEPILRAIRNARPVETRQEKETFLPIFERAMQEAKEANPDLCEIKPYIIDSISINAFAIGNHSIAVTKGTLETFNEDELTALLLHETAHIINGNTKAELLNTIGNGMFSILILIINCLFTLFDYVLWDTDESTSKEESRHPRTLFLVIRFVFNLYIQLILFVGNLLLARNSRKNEFLADKYAFDLGYGDNLINVLYLLQKFSLTDKMTLVDKMLEKHPRVSQRIEKLENLEDETA